MAKGAFLSVKRGKLGDAIGYNISNSNNGERQGWRIYQPVVANPQTDAQMVQRVKLAAVNNLYRALKSVISRGFESKEYGDPSRRAWLRVALGQDFSSGPWLVKGSTVPVPIKTVPITVGSLPPVTVTYDTDGEYFFTSIVLSASTSAVETVADVSRLFISADYQEGDQVTVITGWVPIGQAFAWNVKSFYLNTSDPTPLQDLGIYTDTWINGDQYNLEIKGRESADAIAIAISRDGDGSHLRSTSYVATNPISVDAVYYGAPMYVMAKASYLITAATRSANWPLQPGEGAASGIYTAVTLSGVTVTLNQVAIVDGYALVTDTDGNTYYVKNQSVQQTAYNRYLKAKTGELLADVWTTTAPSDATDADTLKYGMDTSSSGYRNEGFYNFLVANGFDPLGLLSQLPSA